MNVEIALQINRLIHNECKDVPHDIGLKIEDIISNYLKWADTDLCEFSEWCSKNGWVYIDGSDIWGNNVDRWEEKTTSDLKKQWEIETGRRKV